MDHSSGVVRDKCMHASHPYLMIKEQLTEQAGDRERRNWIPGRVINNFLKVNYLSNFSLSLIPPQKQQPLVR